MGGYDDQHEIPIIARGEGPYVWDEHGNRYLDASARCSAATPATAGPSYARRPPRR